MDPFCKTFKGNPLRIELEERQCDKDNKSHFVDARQLGKEQDEMLLRGYKLIQQAQKNRGKVRKHNHWNITCDVVSDKDV